MRKIALLATLCLSMLSISTMASAAGPLDDVLACLKQQAVCVMEGAEDATPDTPRELASQLANDDRIVIVMLPASSVASINGGLSAVARSLDEATQQHYIISLSAGDEAVGYSSILPPGVAADLMERAVSVSTNMPETHGTFARNIHNWQEVHPEATPPPPTSPDEDEFPVGILSIGVLFFAGGIGFIVTRRRQLARERRERIPQFTAPHAVKELLEAIMMLRHQINDTAFSSQLEQTCRDTDAYFMRNQQSRHIGADIEMFSGHLQRVLDVLSQYIDVQNHPRYYRTPTASMAQGRTAVEGYAAFVLSNIQRGVDLRMVDFTVNTDILSTQRGV